MSAESELRVIAAAARAGIDAGALVRRAGGADRLLRASAKRLDALGVVPGLARELAAARAADVAEYTAELAGRGIVCVARSDPAYPAPLRELADPPLAVFAMGAGAGPPPVVPGRALAIVGARRAGAPALALARRLAAFAAGAGIPVVSGLGARRRRGRAISARSMRAAPPWPCWDAGPTSRIRARMRAFTAASSRPGS